MSRCPGRPEEGVGSLGAGVIGGCEPPMWVQGATLRSCGSTASALSYLLSHSPKPLSTKILNPFPPVIFKQMTRWKRWRNDEGCSIGREEGLGLFQLAGEREEGLVSACRWFGMLLLAKNLESGLNHDGF